MADIVKCTTFAEFIRLLNNGGLHADLSAALPEIAAAEEACGIVAAETNLPVYRGTPESTGGPQSPQRV